MSLGEAEAPDRGRLEVDLDEHRRLISDDPGVGAGPGLDVRRCRLEDLTVVKLDVRPLGEEAGVSMLTSRRTDEWHDANRPAHPRRIDRSLDPGVADLAD